jgi:hypothetical protein
MRGDRVDLHLPGGAVRRTLDEVLAPMADAQARGYRLRCGARRQLDDAVDLSQYVDGMRLLRTGNEIDTEVVVEVLAVASALGLNGHELLRQVSDMADDQNKRLERLEPSR